MKHLFISLVSENQTDKEVEIILRNQKHKTLVAHADLDIPIFDLWLACYTQEEIAARVGCSQPEVSKFIPNGDIAILNKNQQASADHADPDIHPSRTALTQAFPFLGGGSEPVHNKFKPASFRLVNHPGPSADTL